MAKKTELKPGTNEQYDRFVECTKRIVAVPKSEIDKAKAEEKAAKPKARAKPRKIVDASR